MKPLLIFAFLFSATIVLGQCTSTMVPNDIYYPNSNVTTSVQAGVQYLCGPNTVVWDTFPGNGCKLIYMNSGSTLTLKFNSCFGLSGVMMKSGAVLNVLPGTGALFISYEAGAIINPTTALSNSSMCPVASFPTVNCSPNLIKSNAPSIAFNIWPSPTSNKVNFDFSNFADKTAEITFENQFGQSVKTFKQFSLDRNEIPIDDLPNGSYFVIVQTSTFKQTRKLIVLR